MRLIFKSNFWKRLACVGMVMHRLARKRESTPAQGKAPALPGPQESHRAVSVETRPQLFAVLCALDAAGFESGVDTTNEAPGRIQLRRRMLALQGPAVDGSANYYKEHALGDSGATFSRFVSFALP